MQRRLDSQERLEVLRTIDVYRRWHSLDDKRVCAVCDKIISGRQVEIEGRAGDYTLHCPTPGCPSNFSHWFLYRPEPDAPESASLGGSAGECNFLPRSDW